MRAFFTKLTRKGAQLMSSSTSGSSSKRGISQISTSTVVPPKTARVTLDPTSAQFATTLARFQTNVCGALDDVLTYLNAVLVPAPSVLNSSTRAVAQQSTVLARPDGLTLCDAYPLTIAIPSASVPASASSSVVANIPLAANSALASACVYSATKTAGTATISIVGESNATLTLGAGYQSTVCASPIALNSVTQITVTSSSTWAIPTSVIYLTIYVGILTA